MMSRFDKIEKFFDLEYGTNEEFEDFVNKIELASMEINKMDGMPLEITDELRSFKLITGVNKNHKQTFSSIISALNVNGQALTYKEVLANMRPVALQAEQTDKKQNSGYANKAVERKANECFDYSYSGQCPREKRGENCPYSHHNPGNKTCPHCGGKHRPGVCPTKSTGRTQDDKKSLLKRIDNLEKQLKQEQSGKKNKATSALKSKKTAARSKPDYFDSSSSEDDGYNSDSSPSKANVAREQTRDDNFLRLTFTSMVTLICCLFSFISRGTRMFQRFSLLGTMAAVVVALLLVFPQGVESSHVRSSDMSSLNRYHHHMGSSASKLMDVCMLVGQRSNRRQLVWSIDSGCTLHITNDPSVLDKKSTYARRRGIETANGTFMYSTLVGSCTIRSKDATGAMRKLVLQDVHYVPTASSNLISVTRLLEKHHRVVFDDAMCQIVNKRSKDTMVVKVKSDMFDVCQMISAA